MQPCLSQTTFWPGGRLWATSSLLAFRRCATGAFATRWRMAPVVVVLWTIVVASGHLLPGCVGHAGLSGMVGIFIGDTALFGATSLGSRRAMLLPPMRRSAPSSVLWCWVSAWRCDRQGAALTVAG